MPATGVFEERSAVVVIGCDETGSAIAWMLHRAGASVIIVDRADPGWARRGMAYTDAWYVGGATLQGVDACFCASVKSLPSLLARGDMIAATTWPWEGVAAAMQPVAVIAARIERRGDVLHSRPRTLDGVLTIGVGVTHVGGWPVDVPVAGVGCIADDRAPAKERSRHRIADDTPARVFAPHGGRFLTGHEVAERVEAGDVVGDLGPFAVVAPVRGMLTALAARGARIETGQMLAEVTQRCDASGCYGIAPSAAVTAHRVAAAVRNIRGDGGPSRRSAPATENPACGGPLTAASSDAAQTTEIASTTIGA